MSVINKIFKTVRTVVAWVPMILLVGLACLILGFFGFESQSDELWETAWDL